MNKYTSLRLSELARPIMFEEIPFITFSYQGPSASVSTDFFLLLILYIIVYPGKTNVSLDANGLIMFVLNVTGTWPLIL